MVDYGIQDLVLAGVQWEITDVPMAIRSKWEKATPDNNSGASVASSRGAVVPPIAPGGTVSPETAISMAARPNDTENLIRMISEFNHPLRSGATNTVLPHIAQNPNGLVIVTDVPGADDDASGRILSGASGELLDKMLMAIGMTRDNVSIVPIVFWRTPGGRTPTADELDLTRPFVKRAIEFLNPRVILTLGATPAKEIADVNLSSGHGRLCQDANRVCVMPIYHPNYLLLKPSAKRDVWNALQELQNLLKNQ